MYEVCESYFASHQIQLNRAKSVYFVAGLHHRARAFPASDLLIGGTRLQPVKSTTFLGFELRVTATGRVVVDVAKALRKLCAAANALFSIPRCPRPLLRARLAATFALTHADYVWQAVDHITPRGVRRLNSVVCHVLRRALGLHWRCNADLACSAALVVPPRFRAAQLRIHCEHQSADSGLLSRIRELREDGIAARTAARNAWASEAPAELVCRALAVRSLLSRPDPFSKAMAWNTSVPSALR